MASIIGNNAIGWAQFQLNGGWKNTLGVLGAYAVIVGGLIAVTASIEPRYASTVLSSWTKGLLGLQLALLVLYGSIRIITGIRRDLTGLMIESHRLMPVPPLHAIAGYIFGSASQAILSLVLVNLILGVVTSTSAGLPIGYWLKANVIIATFAVFLWTIVAVAAMSARGALFWVIGPMVGFWLTGGALSLVLPGLSVVVTPTQGVSVFDARLVDREVALYAAPLICQALIAVICVAAAMRKYRRSDDAAFGPWLALAMLAAVVLTLTVGLGWFEELRPQYLGEDGDFDVQIIASMLVVMGFTAATMCSIAWAEELARRASRRRVALKRRSLSPLAGIVVAAGIGVGLNYATPPHGWDQSTFLRYSAGILLVHALTISYLARWVYARVERAVVIVIIWIALTWLGPLIADLVLRVMTQSELEMGTIAAWSPIGCFIALVNPNDDADPLIGLIGQLALMLIPVTLYYVEQLRKRRAADTAPVPTGAAIAPDT